MSIESMMTSNHLILCRPLLLLPSIPPSIRVFSRESAVHIRWPKYWSFSFSISPPNKDSGLISLISPVFLKRSLVSPILLSPFLCTVHLRRFSYLSLLFSGTLHSVGRIFPFPPCLSLLFSAVCKVSSDNHFACLNFFWGWFWSPPPAQCYKPPAVVLQAPCEPDLIPRIYSSLPLYSLNWFDLGCAWMTYWFFLLCSI